VIKVKVVILEITVESDVVKHNRPLGYSVLSPKKKRRNVSYLHTEQWPLFAFS